MSEITTTKDTTMSWAGPEISQNKNLMRSTGGEVGVTVWLAVVVVVGIVTMGTMVVRIVLMTVVTTVVTVVQVILAKKKVSSFEI